jgi:hypothetical protein
MAPIQDPVQANPQANLAGEQHAIDHHTTAPQEIDLAQEYELLRAFHEFCAITNYGSTLHIIEKRYNEHQLYDGLTETRIPLPEQFNGNWCRFFYRGLETLILVMDYDQQDFVIYNLTYHYRLGRWMLPQALPDGAYLTSVITLDGENDFQLVYSHNENVYTLQRSFNAPQWSHWNPEPVEPLLAVH